MWQTATAEDIRHLLLSCIAKTHDPRWFLNNIFSQTHLTFLLCKFYNFLFHHRLISHQNDLQGSLKNRKNNTVTHRNTSDVVRWYFRMCHTDVAHWGSSASSRLWPCFRLPKSSWPSTCHMLCEVFMQLSTQIRFLTRIWKFIINQPRRSSTFCIYSVLSDSTECTRKCLNSCSWVSK